jgi:putative heme-binding domain-containing protein
LRTYVYAAFVTLLVVLSIDGPRVITAELLPDGRWQQTAAIVPSRSAKHAPTNGAASEGAVRDAFQALPGYRVERLFTVPKDLLGSWVCLTVDDKGRLLASDQDKAGICRITPSPLASEAPTTVERLRMEISSAQGMLHAFGSLYLSINDGGQSGLYRARDTDGDDQYDELVRLKQFRGADEHGPHSLRLTPDGQSILVICGNHTNPPFDRDEEPRRAQFSSRIPTNWDEDLLLPRLWDPSGHARGRMAPGGWIAKTDPEGKCWEVYSIGYRNAFDMDFNADGELFVYDADMERDMGLPWYRPTRVVHATSGSEFGWRSGSGKWPTYFPDSLPAMIDIGPGSPVGVAFGSGTRFPAKYQRACFICDWTFGTIYALHLQPDGASYHATKEEFLSRTPLPLTDIVVGSDGALYFATGGRKLPSELYRVSYVGDEPTTAVAAHETTGAELRDLRRKIESFHGQAADDPSSGVDFLFPLLGHDDRFIRYAVRVAIEFQPAQLWQDRVLSADNIETRITGALAVARQADRKLQTRLLEALITIDWDGLSMRQRLDLLRAYQLALIRMGESEETIRAALTQKLESFYPAKDDLVSRELCSLLAYLQSPHVVSKTLPLFGKSVQLPQAAQYTDLIKRNMEYGRPIFEMMENQADPQKIHYAFALRDVKVGWTLEQRKEYFAFLRRAAKWSGGQSVQGYLRNIDRDAFDSCSDRERLAMEAMGARKPFSVSELPKPEGPGREWTKEAVTQLATPGLHERDFAHGQKMFAAARCIVCHRFYGEGGATGPDLTQLAGRFSLSDLLDSIFEPSKVISDQYRATTIQTTSGTTIVGRIATETKDKLIVLADAADSTKTVELARADIERQQPSTLSEMPLGLLSPLNETELLDLVAYLLSRGNANDPMFRR